MTYQHQYLK